MTNPSPSQLHDVTPDRWTLEASTTSQHLEDAKHARWTYNPRPRISVEVTRVQDSGGPKYTTKKSTVLLEREYEAREDGFIPQVGVAEQLMYGIKGISAHEINHRLGQKGAGYDLAQRVDSWSRLKSLYEASNGDLTFIDGVGHKANNALSVAVEEKVFEQQPVDAVRSSGEARDNDAVYVILPTVAGEKRGWRVRKEWRKGDTDQLQSSVFFPTEEPMGATFKSVDAAVAAAHDAARDRADDHEDLVFFEVDSDVIDPSLVDDEGDQLTITDLGD